MKRSFFSGLTVLLFFTLSGFSGLSAFEVPPVEFRDSAGVRSLILNDWLWGELDRVRLLQPEELADPYGYRFAVSQKRDADNGFLSITVSPVDKTGVQGEWVLRRRLSDGLPDCISVYPLPDRNVRVDLRPEGTNPEKGRSRLDLVIYGAFAIRDASVGIPFTALYSAPFSTVVSLTVKTAPWDLLDPDPRRYADVESAASKIRERLGTLVYLEDGAFDENGNPVLIEDGSAQDPSKVWEALSPGQNPADVTGGVNCSGFAKWIVDGIVRPAAGQGTLIAPLRTQTASPETHFTELVRESRDLFFALDWTRNLASSVVSLTGKKTVKPDVSGVDVTAGPFPDSCAYSVNVGYRTREILPLLYWLAVRESGHIYLGAISRERGVPAMRQYHHVAAFFPYFDANGQFTVAVFESAAETPIQTFLERNGDSYVNLVRIRMPEAAYFEP